MSNAATTRTVRRLCAILNVVIFLLATPCTAQDANPTWPTVRSIAFSGNQVTQPQTLLREMSIQVGAPANPAEIERSRQAILDLGLFRSVKVDQAPVEDGVGLTFSVREKWYILPYPRLSANSDGQDSIGAELRWNNVGGLNHSLRAVVSSSDRREEGHGRKLGYQLSYHAPFLFDSPYTLDTEVSRESVPIQLDDMPPYDQTIDQIGLIVSRKIDSSGAASQGWRAGGGLLWRRQNTAGPDAPTPWGDTYALLTQLDYRNEHDYVYSERGTAFNARYEFADQNVLSDYTYKRLTARYRYSMAFGRTPHQTLEFAAAAGDTAGDRSDTAPFTLGGTQGLRGYARNRFEGNAYYLVSASYLRPVHWNWLRFVATLEAGNVYDEPDELDANIRWSLGLGFRIRLTHLVHTELEFGIALPLDNDGARFYGYRNGF